MRWHAFTILIVLVSGVSPVSASNGILGEPEIFCSKEELKITMFTDSPFRGSIYVKDYFDSPECRSDYARNQQTSLTFALPFGTCGIEKRRSVNPSLTLSAVIIVKFHSLFLTKHDKAYEIKCHFDRSPKNVTSSVAVADLEVKPMMHDTASNECEYTLRGETVEGPILHRTNLGDTTVHRWQCKDPDQKILVKNCIARGTDEEIQVIDERGCPTSDEFTEVTYSSETSMAFVAVDAFRFPDHATMRFECQIEFCSVEACVGLTPPNCPNIYPSDFKPNSVILQNEDERHETQIYGVFDQPFRTTTSISSLKIPVSEAKPAFPLPVKNTQSLGWDRRRDQPPLFTEVKAAHQQSSEGYLLLKKEKNTDASSLIPNSRPRRDEGRVRSVRSETIFVGNSPHAFVDPIVKKPELCWQQNEAIILVYLATLIGVYAFALTMYIAYDLFRTRSRARKAIITDSFF